MGSSNHRAAVDDAERAAATAASESYGRLVALLASSTRDVAAAEDALADAFEAALRTWPDQGVPTAPDAWLLTTARRKLIDAGRRAQTADRAEPSLALLLEELASADRDSRFPDKRLELLFVCAHPAIDVRIRTPLMLQTVLGLDAKRMAGAFLVAPATLSQRLVRAKHKIRDAGIRFRIPEPDELPERLDAVLEAIYGGYTAGRSTAAAGDDHRRGQVATEAVRLARLMVELLPDHPEALGLLAVILYTEARRDAGRDPEGRFIPLTEQDTGRWSADLRAEGDAAVRRAAAAGYLGPFGIEANIQAAHMARAETGATDWRTIRGLYDTLLLISPTIGARVAAAAAALEADGPAAALDRLNGIEADDAAVTARYQPWWAVRAHALQRLGDPEALAAFDRAAGMTDDPAIRAWLLERAATSSADRA
ncbi:MAG: DUF6596 domain-containing protein [Actinomycetota bacterium]